MLAFLILDGRADTRFLLAKTLFRKFPRSVLHECSTREHALEIARAGDLSAIILHRVVDDSGTDLVREIRRANPTAPIVVVSSLDQHALALAAGAEFLHSDEWLRIGSVVGELLSARRDPSGESAEHAAKVDRPAEISRPDAAPRLLQRSN